MKEDRDPLQHKAAFADGALCAVDGREGDDENLVESFCFAFGVNEMTAIEMLAFADKHAPAQQVSRYTQTHKDALFEKAMRELFRCQKVTVPVYAMCYTLGGLLPGLDDVIGGMNPTEYAQAVARGANQEMTRANVTKFVKDFQHGLGVPPREGQRQEEACELMSEIRKGQCVTSVAATRGE
jgi:hypothetical protein